MISNVSVIGGGKLGASMVAGMASRGFNVICIDKNPDVVDLLNAGRAPVFETGLEDMVSENADRISATLDFDEAISNSDVSFVIVPTPSEDSGAFSTAYAEEAFANIGSALKKKNGYHVVVLTSTVLPGATRATLLPILENFRQKMVRTSTLLQS